MAQFRFKALDEVLNRKPVEIEREDNLVSDYYGMLVFDQAKMKKIFVARSIQSGYRCR